MTLVFAIDVKQIVSNVVSAIRSYECLRPMFALPDEWSPAPTT